MACPGRLGTPPDPVVEVRMLSRERRLPTRPRRDGELPEAARAEWRPMVSAAGTDELAGAVLGAQQGYETAFSQVYLLVQPGLLRYLSVLIGSDAEDVASETWVHVCRDLHTFSGDGDGFRGWVATIGRHRALDHLRARGRRPSTSAAPETLHGLAGTDDTASQAEESLSTATALKMIQALPQDQAEAVLLRAVIGLDAKSAGQVLAKRPGAVRTSAYRGLRNLAQRLDEDRSR